jgi:uncharacterized protein YkwD
MAGVSVAAACALLAITVSPAFAWGISSFSPGDEQLLFSLTNQDRASAGLNALVNDSYLHAKAEWRAQDMGDRNYFSHAIPPDNRMVFSYMQSDGYCFKVAGENIGLSTWGDSVATNRIEIAFMGSTSHRTNILGSWARMGVGAYKAADGRKLYTVLFSVPCGVTVAPPLPAPTPVATSPPAVGPDATPTPPPAPTLKPAPKPTLKPAPKPTARPVLTPQPAPSVTAAPSDTPSPTPSDTPSATPTPGPTATLPAPTAMPSGSAVTADTVASLRVRERPVSQDPVDSLFRWLFGGLFG